MLNSTLNKIEASSLAKKAFQQGDHNKWIHQFARLRLRSEDDWDVGWLIRQVGKRFSVWIYEVVYDNLDKLLELSIRNRGLDYLLHKISEPLYVLFIIRDITLVSDDL